ncbi:MAG: hypothetical protein ACTHU0_20405 [Kofleriaceae bacterium]
MADRLDYYFRQRVTEAELDLAFELLEKADRNLVADIGVFGVVRGAVATPHGPVPDLTIDLTAPAVGYDRLGQRLFFGAGQRIDCSVDESGIPTAVTSAGRERWLGVFLRFDRLMSDPRTDGNSQLVYFRRDESFKLVVRQGPEAGIGAAPKVALQPDELLLCDVLRSFGQTQVLAGDLDTSRRQAFVFATGDAVEVASGVWSTIVPAANTVQAALDSVDALLTEHFGGTGHRHSASQVTSVPRGFVAATNVQAALNELVDGLGATTAGSPGSSHVGADAVAGTPHAMAAGSVDGQLSQLLGHLNGHVSTPAAAHTASAISAAPHNGIAATNVQGQLQEIVADLASAAAIAPGAGLVGVDAIAGAPNALSSGTVRGALATLLSHLNAHATQAVGVHAASAISVADVDGLLSSVNVEKALAEVLDALSKEHFRGNEASGGQHRAIHQPNLGGSRALLWDSIGTGGPGARFRVYADGESIWFTVNAASTSVGAPWVRDDATLTSGGFRFSRNEFAIVHAAGSGPSFAAWSSTWRLPISSPVNTAFELQGTMQEVGRLGIGFTNPDSVQRSVMAGGSVNFRNRFAAQPSSVTLWPVSLANTFLGDLNMSNLDRDGFVFIGVQNLAALATTWWFGHYTAIA